MRNLPPLVLDSLDRLSSHTVALLAALPHQDPCDLRAAYTEQKEVDRGEEEVAGLDHEAPARPDQTCRDEGAVLREGEGGGWTGEVGGAGEDESPLFVLSC